MTCAQCGWPMRLLGQKKILATFLVSFRCMNPRCEREQTQIGQSN
jgi:hypothetical protein